MSVCFDGGLTINVDLSTGTETYGARECER